jgi:hypothetical protein
MARSEELRVARQMAIGFAVWLVVAICAVYARPQLESIWDRRWQIAHQGWFAPAAVVVLVAAATALFALRTLQRKAYAVLELFTAVCIAIYGARRFAQIATDQVNAVTTLLTIAGSVYLFIRGIDNYRGPKGLESPLDDQRESERESPPAEVIILSTFLVLMMFSVPFYSDYWSGAGQFRNRKVRVMRNIDGYADSQERTLCIDEKQRLLWMKTESLDATSYDNAKSLCHSIRTIGLASPVSHWRLPKTDEAAALWSELKQHDLDCPISAKGAFWSDAEDICFTLVRRLEGVGLNPNDGPLFDCAMDAPILSEEYDDSKRSFRKIRMHDYGVLCVREFAGNPDSPGEEQLISGKLLSGENATAARR